MKKKETSKVILGSIVVICIMIVVLGISIIYVRDYKVTTVDISSPSDGKYELVLQAVGEADWPFGSASGQLVLKKGKTKISKAGFELFDDGGGVCSGIWEVTWHEDYVEVILSGEEQFDEQITLYFDGRKEIKQLTDKEKLTENENVNENEVINSQAAYVSEPEKQDDIEMGEKDMNLYDNNSIDDDILIDEIYKYMIPEQSFDVTLDDWGEVTFVACKPTYKIEHEYASFYLLRDEQILYRFPYRYEDNTMGHEGSFDSVGAVAFRDINDDGKDDIIVIVYYYSGAGPTGMVPRPDIRIFLAEENEFYLAEDIIVDIEQHIFAKDMTIENICNFLQ